jgi:hypothetical protein
LCCAVILVGVVPSCIVLPTPPYHSGNARENVDTTVPARFQPGKATRAEVILALGEPDAVSANERTLAYRTEKVRAILMVGGYGAGAAAPISKDEYLVFDFDARGKLVSSRTSGHWGHADLGRTLGTSTTPANSSGWSGDATWLVGVDDYRAKGYNPEIAWLRGRLELSDHGLEFRSRKEFANAPPALTLAYRDIIEVAEDPLLLGSVLAIHTRQGKALAFQVFGKSSWHSDVQRLRDARDFIQRHQPKR